MGGELGDHLLGWLDGLQGLHQGCSQDHRLKRLNNVDPGVFWEGPSHVLRVFLLWRNGKLGRGPPRVPHPLNGVQPLPNPLNGVTIATSIEWGAAIAKSIKWGAAIVIAVKWGAAKIVWIEVGEHFDCN